MKKINAIICLILIILTFSGCADAKKPDETTMLAVSSTGTTAEEVTTTTKEYTVSSATTEIMSTTAEYTTTAVPLTTKPDETTHTQSLNSTSPVPTSKKPTTTKAIKETTTAAATTKKVTTTKPTTTKPTTTKPTTTKPTEKASVCYVTIVCTTINDNLNMLKDSKKPFVPSDGIILAEAPIEVKDGDTAFEIIKKACKENTCKAKCKYCKKDGIQIEYTYTPAFDNYYIEGIHQIYEKDCGSASGWMYSVNGVFPNVGASSYEINRGDKIVFAYTCDMGDDIGNSY